MLDSADRVLSGEDQVLNVYPVRLLGLVSAMLAGVHWSLSLRGRFVLVVALCWAFATTSLATFFAASMSVGISGWELLLKIQGAGLTISALTLFGLAIQLVRRREAPSTGLATRLMIAVGLLMLGAQYMWLVLRGAGLLQPSETGLQGMAEDAARLSIDLIASCIPLALGAAMHLLLKGRRGVAAAAVGRANHRTDSNAHRRDRSRPGGGENGSIN